MIFKIFWILRGLLYKPFFGKFELPSYIGKAIFIGNSLNLSNDFSYCCFDNNVVGHR